MRQRQIAGQREGSLAAFFVFQLLLSQELLRLVKLVLGQSQFSKQLLVSRSELAIFVSQFLSPCSLRIATSDEISGDFVGRRFVLPDRFQEKPS